MKNVNLQDNASYSTNRWHLVKKELYSICEQESVNSEKQKIGPGAQADLNSHSTLIRTLSDWQKPFNNFWLAAGKAANQNKQMDFLSQTRHGLIVCMA